MAPITLPTADSLDKALKAANPGDTIVVSPGGYTAQTLEYDASMEGASQPVTVMGAGVTLGGLELHGIQHVVFDGFTLGGLMNVRPSSGSSWTATSKASHDLVFRNMDGKTFLLRNVTNVTVKDSRWGGWDSSKTALGPPKVGAYEAASGVAQKPSQNVLVENCFFHEFLRTVTGTAHTEGFYIDGGTDGLTLRGNWFTNCGVMDIHADGMSPNLPIRNIVIESNLLDVPRDENGAAAPYAINLKGVPGMGGKVTLRGNSILGSVMFGGGDSSAYQWVSEKNAIGNPSDVQGQGPTDVRMLDPGFVAMQRVPCDLNACYRNDLHVKADSPAGRSGAGVPVAGTPPPEPPPDDLPLTVISETATEVVLGWTPVPGAYGYAFTRDLKVISQTWDGTRSQVKFSKGGVLGVQTLMPGPSGDWPV